MTSANDIARQLVADGVPDDAMHVHTEGLKGGLIWRSFHKAAGITIEETITKPVHVTRWRDPAAETAQITALVARKQGVKSPIGTRVAPGLSAPQNAAFDMVG